MKQIKFDACFKEAILNKEKVATIRNSKKVDVDEIFEIVIDDEVVGKAECVSIIKIKTFVLFGIVKKSMQYQRNHITIPKPLSFVFEWELGFKNIEDLAGYYYKNYLKNEHCYLHIFEVIREKQ